jgi:OmcA/MtrC family decaheme c-type cytochrome
MLAKRGALLAVGFMALVPLSPADSRTTRVVGTRDPITGPQSDSPQSKYPSSSKEFWLTQDQFDFIRPGFHITVNSVTIPADGQAIADLSFTDDGNQPLDRLGQITPGALSVSLILAWWDAGARQYTAYTTRSQKSPITGVTAIQAGTDSGGTWTDLAVGHSTYRFKTVVTSVPGVPYDATKTHTLAIYATRATSAILGKDYYANAEFDFRPDNVPPTETWDIIAKAACNTCHNPLSAHGGSRQDVKLCVTCHSPQTTDPDTGNTVDFKVMVHKIHMAGDLPSVQAGGEYHIIGFQQSDNIFAGDPQKKVPDVVFPRDIRNCTTCHGSIDPNQPNYTTQAFTWFTYPTRAACQSCHDDINFATGENHPAGAQADDSQCASCHLPTSGGEWNAAVIDAHTVPFKSTQLKGVKAEIVSVTNTAPGQNPTVLFTMTQNDGTPIPPSSFTTNNSDGSTSSGLNVLMSGPTVDYAVPPQIRERADGATASGANNSYTFTHAIPADATGTWGFSIEARLTVTLNPAPKDTATVRDSAFNPVAYAPVTDSVAVPRRMVVDIAKCNTCHDRLALHGSNRLNPQECVFCHNPNGNDGREPPESIDFKRMIHRIHTGTDLTHDYSIGDDGSFNGVRFPGDRRDCETCHIAGTEEVIGTPPAGWLATPTPRDWYTPMLHYATACLGCHDTQAAAAHAFLNTAPFGEACAVCHGADGEEAVDKVHAR